MLFINATLSKNQPYKLKNQINKVPIISKQDSIEFFSNISGRHFNVCNLFSCYHNGRILICQYQGVMLRFLILLIGNSEPSYIQIVYQSFIRGNILICKFVHTSRDNKCLK